MELARILEALKRVKVVVIGDLMLDHYIWGEVDRISPEAPVPILRVAREETRPGGAGSVLANVAALETDVRAISVTGADRAGDELCEHLAAKGIDVSGIVRDPGRNTTQKTRLLARVQQLLRLDRDYDVPLTPELETTLRGHIDAGIAWADVVLCSDYGKGVLASGLAAYAAKAARAKGIPCVVDPFRHADFSRYQGASCVTPNRKETENATGIAPTSVESFERAAIALIEKYGLDFAAITLDKDGIYLKRRDGPHGALFPAKARAVFDVAGAGDMVLSVLGVVLGGGFGVEDAVRLANVASGLEVERLGVAAIPKAEILREVRGDAPPALARKIVDENELRDKLAEAHRQGRRIVFTNGCFDIVHPGHVRYFQFCRGLGDVLVVGLNTDRSIRELKGAGRPILALDERATILAGLAAIDYVIAFDESTPAGLIARLKPDVLVKGEDYKDKEVVGRDTVEANGGQVVLAPLLPGMSTTSIIDRVNAATGRTREQPV